MIFATGISALAIYVAVPVSQDPSSVERTTRAETATLVAGATVFARACLECHGPTGPSSFDLTSESARIRSSATAALAVREGLMPPWLPSRSGQSLHGSRELSPVDRQALLAWLDAGAPGPVSAPEPIAGSAISSAPSNHQSPNVRLADITSGWVLSANPGMVIRAFAIGQKLHEQLLIAGVEMHCESPGLIHEVSLLTDSAGFATRLDAADPDPGYDALGDIGLVASGSAGAVSRLSPRWMLPQGFAISIPRDSVIVAEVHTDARGKIEPTTTSIDLIPAELGARVLHPLSLNEIRPVTIEEDTLAIAIHVRADGYTKSLCVRALSADGLSVTLLDIPSWNDRLSEPWVFLEPFRLCAGSTISVESVRHPTESQDSAESQATSMMGSGGPTVVILTH